MVPVMTEEDIRQGLLDAGCDAVLIQGYLEAARSGDRRKCLLLLERRRRALLDEIHGGQKRLDCLDYLRYQLKKNGPEA